MAHFTSFCPMQGQKKKLILFQTKTIYFPPLKKSVNVLLQQRDGPCLLIAIFNSLVLKGKLSVEPGVYSSSVIIDLIQNFNPHVHKLKKIVNGFFVNPSFYSCAEFVDYPRFLEKLDLKLVHAMIPDKKNKNFEIISKYDYDTMQIRLIDLVSDDNSNSAVSSNDELKALKNWNAKLAKQVTDAGIDQIETQMDEGEVQIFFRNAHFACIYKHLNHVYSLITCKGLGGANCTWHSLPNAKGDFTYYDEHFVLTTCKPWTAEQKIKTSTKITAEQVIEANLKNREMQGKTGLDGTYQSSNTKKSKHSKKSECVIA